MSKLAAMLSKKTASLSRVRSAQGLKGRGKIVAPPTSGRVGERRMVEGGEGGVGSGGKKGLSIQPQSESARGGGVSGDCVRSDGVKREELKLRRQLHEQEILLKGYQKVRHHPHSLFHELIPPRDTRRREKVGAL